MLISRLVMNYPAHNFEAAGQGFGVMSKTAPCVPEPEQCLAQTAYRR
jgi:hypothetical protein